MYLATNGNAPKFVFIHIVAPHPPYVFNQDGSFNLRQPTGYTSWEPRKDYLEQLIYVNKVVEKFVAKITSNPKRMPIVVLQSDHGPWIKDASELNVFAARRGILNAYLVPKDWRSSFESNTDPVNSFRIILNKLFNADFDCLPLQVPDRRSFLQGYAHK
jgi:hypothetical protein